MIGRCLVLAPVPHATVHFTISRRRGRHLQLFPNPTQGVTGLDEALACTVEGSRIWVSNYQGNNVITCALNATGFPTNCGNVGYPIGAAVGIAIRGL